MVSSNKCRLQSLCPLNYPSEINNSVKTEQTQSGCVYALIVYHVCSRFTSSLWGEVGDAESSVAGKKGADQVANGEKKEDAPAPPESKTSKKKKSKKDKSSKESKEAQDQGNGSEKTAGAEPNEDTASVDVKERIKKVASMKKKKSSKEMDAAAKIAASEAAARSARLAAAKKKEKSHYNQQPVR